MNARPHRDIEEPYKRETEAEYRLGVEYVREGARDEHKGSEGQGVCREDPLKGAGGEVQVFSEL